MHAARRMPDGTFVFEQESYKLEERDRDRFAVVRARDHRLLGELRFEGDRCEVTTEADVPSSEAEAVRAISLVLEAPRGLLPLQ